MPRDETGRTRVSAGGISDGHLIRTHWLSLPAAARGLDPAVVIAFGIMFVLVLCLPPILNDSDTLWQIRTGEWILNHRAIPAIDPFSYTAGDRPWFAHEWLAETLMAIAWRAGGMQAVMALAAAAVGLTSAVLLHQARRFLPGLYAVLALVVALANAAPSMLARPHLLAWPCLALWCGGLVTARAKRVAPAFALLPVMLLWVNLHGSFMIGLLLPLGFLLEILLDRATDRRVIIAWIGFIVAAWATALLNPDFLAGVLFPFHLVGMHSLTWIGEWQPTDFGRIQPLELVILAALALGLSGKVTLPPIRLLMFLGLIHGALTHGRDEQLLGIIGVLILAEPLGACLGRGHAAPLSRGWRYGAAGIALIAAAGLVARFTVPLSPERTGAAFADTISRVPTEIRTRPVLNGYGLGGDLIFQGVRPFIDSRADLYGDAFLTDYHRLTWPDRDVLRRTLTHYSIGWTIFAPEDRIVSLLDQEPGWRRFLEAGGVVIHVRDGPADR